MIEQGKSKTCQGDDRRFKRIRYQGLIAAVAQKVRSFNG